MPHSPGGDSCSLEPSAPSGVEERILDVCALHTVIFGHRLNVILCYFPLNQCRCRPNAVTAVMTAMFIPHFLWRGHCPVDTRSYYLHICDIFPLAASVFPSARRTSICLRLCVATVLRVCVIKVKRHNL